MQSLRLFFPLFQAAQLTGGVSSAYAQEIKKLRQFGISFVTPHLRRSKLLKYPYKINITYYAYSDIDAVSTLIITAYIIHLFESNGVIQSNDYRVIPNVEVSTQCVQKLCEEGCLITIEKFTK